MASWGSARVQIKGDPWAAAFLASEPDYDEPAWLDACTMALGRKPDMTPAEASQAARHAYARES